MNSKELALYPNLKQFSFLFGVTGNGHLMVFGRSGMMIEMYQLHVGQISGVRYSETYRCLISSGSDNYIRIFSIQPLDPEFLKLEMQLFLACTPKSLIIMSNIIAYESGEGKISMAKFDMEKKSSFFLK
jgi:hypothetical protein